LSSYLTPCFPLSWIQERGKVFERGQSPLSN
jgi:hypothetical protein